MQLDRVVVRDRQDSIVLPETVWKHIRNYSKEVEQTDWKYRGPTYYFTKKSSQKQ